MERKEEREESLPDETKDREDELPECLADETREDAEGSSDVRTMPARTYIGVLTKLKSIGVAEETLQGLTYPDAMRLLNEMQAEKRQAGPPISVSAVQETESLVTMAAFAESLGVHDPKNTLRDELRLKERIILHLEGKEKGSQTVTELLEEVRNKALTFKDSCKTLLELASEVDGFVRRKALQDKRMKPHLDRELVQYEQRIQATKNLLKDGVCPLIVTGEVAAGKSSFLNILCDGEKFSLPISEQVTTSCICELRHGDERKAVVHRANPRHWEQETFEIKLCELEKYVSFENAVQGDKIPYKKVEIYFPSELLKAGLVFVDTPGVGSDNLSMTEFFENYLQDSVGFIYVINDAINVHKLCRLFDIEACTTNAYLNHDVEDLGGVNSRRRRTMFILNKWDQIVKKDEMLDAVQKKLEEHWFTESATQDQPFVHPFSATLDMEHLEAGYVSDRLQNVIERIKEVAVHNMNLILRSRFKWFQFVISRVEYHCQRYLSHADATLKETVSTVKQEAEENLNRAIITGKQCKDELSCLCKTIYLSDAVDDLRGYLKEETVRAMVTDWKEHECPRNDTIDHIEEVAKQKVSKRIQDVLHSWEDKSHYTIKLKMELRQCMKRCLAKLQVDITTVSESLTATRPINPTIPEFPFRFILKSDRGTVAKKILMFLIKTFSGFKKKKYHENKIDCMRDMSNEALDFLDDEQQLRNLLRDLVGFQEIEKKFSQFVDNYVEQFTAEVRDLRKNEKVTTLKEIYTPIERGCRRLQKKLLIWELENIFEGLQVQSKNVSQVGERPIGFNYFADLARGQIARGAEKPLPVVIKKYKGPVDDDIRFIMREYKTLRENHCTAFAQVQGMIEVEKSLSLVMEPAVCSLASWLQEQRNVPKYNLDIFSSQTLSFASDIAGGLVEIHGLKRVHGNLSPTCIMVISVEDDHNKCKLYDIGVLQKTRVPDCFAADCLRDRHAAPELNPPTTFDYSMDIYSFGQVLVDLWDGVPGPLSDTLPESAHVMPRNYRELVQSCTHAKAKSRPRARAVQSSVAEITRCFEDGSSVESGKA